MMKINIYYGGRGLIEDPTLYVINKMTEVLEELRVEVNRYNLYEDKSGISSLTRTLKKCDGVILAASVEWMGIGGLMQLFLDSCWLYADKENLSRLYMMPVVTATTYGEKDAEFTLIKAWEMLGGIPCSGLTAYVENQADFETNPEFALIIEKKAENLYRNISQKTKLLPSSTYAVKKNVLHTHGIDLTPQESEQLSMYVSDDNYVKRQKEDIEELTSLFTEMLGNKDGEPKQEFIGAIEKHFKPSEDFKASYSILMEDIDKTLIVDVDKKELNCYYGTKEDADVLAKTNHETFKSIVSGHMTIQRAFMSGTLSAKGNFKILRAFDTLFPFSS